MIPVDRPSAKESLAHDAGQGTPDIGGHRVAVVERRRIHDEVLVRGEDREVRVESRADAALRGEAGQPRGPLRHPGGDVDQRQTAAPGLGPDHREAQLEGRDPAPGGSEIAAVQLLHLDRARRVVGDDEIDDPIGEALPEQLAVGRLAHRRGALERGGTRADLLGSQGQVMRTRFGSDIDALPSGRGDHRQGIRT